MTVEIRQDPSQTKHFIFVTSLPKESPTLRPPPIIPPHLSRIIGNAYTRGICTACYRERGYGAVICLQIAIPAIFLAPRLYEDFSPRGNAETELKIISNLVTLSEIISQPQRILSRREKCAKMENDQQILRHRRCIRLI